MIRTIRDETGRTVEGMRAGAQQVAEGVSQVNGAEESLCNINIEMGKTTQMVEEITHVSNEQQSSTIELARNVEHVSHITEQNVRSPINAHILDIAQGKFSAIVDLGYLKDSGWKSFPHIDPVGIFHRGLTSLIVSR